MSRRLDFNALVIPEQVYLFECYDKYGRLKWRDVVKNLTVNQGLDDILDKYWKGSAYTATHYLGLLTGTTLNASDTLSSKLWTEFTSYSSPTTRGQLSWGTVSGQSVQATAISFSISAAGIVDGGFIATDGTIGGTATGLLIGENTFSGGSKSVDNGDTLNVTVTASASSA